MSYRAAIFDWDGTMVDTCGLILNAHNHVRQHFDMPTWTMDDFLGRASQSAREYYPQVYGDDAEEAQRVLYDYVEEHHLNHLQPIDGALQALDQLKTAGVQLGVVSNKRHHTLLKEIDYLGWGAYFDGVVGAGHADKDKPSEVPLLLAMEYIDKTLAISDVLYFGDTETDLLCAQNAGVDIVFLPFEKERPELIENYNPKHYGKSIEEIVKKVFFTGVETQIKAC